MTNLVRQHAQFAHIFWEILCWFNTPGRDKPYAFTCFSRLSLRRQGPIGSSLVSRTRLRIGIFA